MDSRFFCGSISTSKGEGVVESINTAEEQQNRGIKNTTSIITA
jgi:acetyl-CoA carboxylase beta subunit